VVAESRIFFLRALPGWSGCKPRFLRMSVPRAGGRRPAVPPHSTPRTCSNVPNLGPSARLFTQNKKDAPVRFDMCPFGTGARYMVSNKGSKQLEINGLGCFGGAFFGGPIWTIQPAKTFPWSSALLIFFAGALPCSVALVFGFGMFVWKVQHGASEGVNNMYKTSEVLPILKMADMPGAATKCIPKNKHVKQRSKIYV